MKQKPIEPKSADILLAYIFVVVTTIDYVLVCFAVVIMKCIDASLDVSWEVIGILLSPLCVVSILVGCVLIRNKLYQKGL